MNLNDKINDVNEELKKKLVKNYIRVSSDICAIVKDIETAFSNSLYKEYDLELLKIDDIETMICNIFNNKKRLNIDDPQTKKDLKTYCLLVNFFINKLSKYSVDCKYIEENYDDLFVKGNFELKRHKRKLVKEQ